MIQGSKISGVQKIVGSKKILGPRNFGSKIILGPKNSLTKKCWLQKDLDPKKNLGPENPNKNFLGDLSDITCPKLN